MWGRVYAVCFVLLVGISIWLQQAYMSAYSAEFESGNVKDRGELELILAKGFSSRSFERGVLRSSLKAGEGIQLNNGKAAFYGGVTYDVYDERGRLQATLTTSNASGKFRMEPRPGGTSLDGTRRPELLEMPEAVRIDLPDDVVRTKKVHVRFADGRIETAENVELQGPERVIRGRGLNYDLNTGEFKIGGPVRGSFVRPQITSRPAGGKERH